MDLGIVIIFYLQKRKVFDFLNGLPEFQVITIQIIHTGCTTSLDSGLVLYLTKAPESELDTDNPLTH